MSTLDLVIAVAGVLTLAALIVDHVPAVIRARAEADAGRTGGGFSAFELELAVMEAVRRTDPDVGPELAERLAATTVEDLIAGRLSPRAEDVA